MYGWFWNVKKLTPGRRKNTFPIPNLYTMLNAPPQEVIWLLCINVTEQKKIVDIIIMFSLPQILNNGLFPVRMVLNL